MKVTIKGFIHYCAPRYEEDVPYSFLAYDLTDSEYADGRVMVMPHDLVVDVPDDFDPTPKQIAALEAEKAKVRAEFNQRIAQLNEQIGKLQALTFDEVK
jgi:hypothetical protein